MVKIRDVWADNLEAELALIRAVVDEYPFIAMDTEFPGVVARPVGQFKSSREFLYRSLKMNVDLLKLIQLGLTFTDSKGQLPVWNGEPCVWQINFRGFSLNEDVYAEDSIQLLKQSGIDFLKNEQRGVDVQRFGELLMSSGVVLNDDVKWITFHSNYDFGYLLKILSGRQLPDTEAEYSELLGLFFPVVYDIKHIMKSCDGLHGGLNKVAEILKVQRVGPQHQAGSDSLLTSLTFFKLVDVKFKGLEGIARHAGILYGMGPDDNGITL